MFSMTISYMFDDLIENQNESRIRHDGSHANFAQHGVGRRVRYLYIYLDRYRATARAYASTVLIA